MPRRRDTAYAPPSQPWEKGQQTAFRLSLVCGIRPERDTAINCGSSSISVIRRREISISAEVAIQTLQAA